MTPQDFIAKWGAPNGVPGPAHALNEEQGAQSHFLDLCELLGVAKPGSAEGYLFEEKSLLIGGRSGYADVFMRGVFAWENKAPGKNLDAALKQLLTYSLALSNPPLLVVSDRLTIRIHTQFTGHPSETHEVRIADMDQPDKLALLRRIWSAPESFKPRLTNRDITEAAAKSFSTLAEGLRRRGAGALAQAGQTPARASTEATQQRANQVAHFLTQCLFCFFAEDVGLLPGRLFERLVTNRQLTPERLTQGLADLFSAMGNGGMFGADEIPWFNGGLFRTIDVPALSILDVTELRNAANLNWSAIDVSIFGTLFERGLDPAKRSQLGAHYTDPATILRIIEPVVQRPLLQLWQQTAQAMQALLTKSRQRKRAPYSAGGRHFKATPGDAAFQKAEQLFFNWLKHLSNYRVLDPACGSGNFLFLGLKCLKDIEHRSHLEAAALGLDREADLVTGPHNVLGIELNEYAAELARVTVWIGELQWRMAHGYEFKTNPVLEPLDHIECRDALLTFSPVALPPLPRAGEGCAALVEEVRVIGPLPRAGEGWGEGNGGSNSSALDAEPEARAGQMPGAPRPSDFLMSRPTSAPPTPLPAQAKPVEATWPQANAVIGNPPFLGGKKFVSELGEAYADSLRSVYARRVPGLADLVSYWFEKARAQMVSGQLEAAGLVATNSLRDGFGREVLKKVNADTPIFVAWSDEPWVNEGAAVRVSLIAFSPTIQTKTLNGCDVEDITADLSATGASGAMDLTFAKRLPGNEGVAFQGTTRSGPFDIPGELARQWLTSPNPHGRSNADVVRPWSNGLDVTRRFSDTWIVDFGISMAEANACLYEKPFEHCRLHVKPTREQNRTPRLVEQWWHYDGVRVGLRKAIAPLHRYIATTITAKYRTFVWFHPSKLPDATLVALARSDDVTFGVLHSRFHELWSLASGSWLGVGNDPRYTPGTTFQTFPFPAGLTPADTAHQKTEEVTGGAWIPAGLAASPSPQPSPACGRGGHTDSVQQHAAGAGRMVEAISKSEAHEPPACAPPLPVKNTERRQQAIAIAKAAKRLNDLRENWLNPPEWTHKVPEVTPLGMRHSPYPDRIEPRPGILAADLKALQQRTLTKLYNQRPAWLTLAHQQLDASVATAYGWTDYSAAMPDEEILKRLLALNLERSDASKL